VSGREGQREVHKRPKASEITSDLRTPDPWRVWGVMIPEVPDNVRPGACCLHLSQPLTFKLGGGVSQQ
jgi:hypothetical protein